MKHGKPLAAHLNLIDGMCPVFERQPRDLARFMLSTQRLDDFCKKST